MTHERDIERLLDHWFSDGPTEAPDRVVDVVADRIGRQSQRPAWRLDWRFHHMPAPLKIATALLAVGIIAILGVNVLRTSSIGIGGPADVSFETVARYDAASLGLDRPLRLAVGPNGDAYVTETGDRVSEVGPDGKVVRRWGSTGTGPGQFDFFGMEPDNGPYASIAVGPDGQVYVSDSDNHRVQVFGSDGAYIRQFGTDGTAPGQFRLPYDLGVDAAGNVYVLDDVLMRLSKFGPDGGFLWTVSGATDPALAGHGHGVYLDPQDRVVVFNDDTGLVVYVDPDGKVVDSFKPRPTCEITVDPSGNVYTVGEVCGDGVVNGYDPAHRQLRTWTGVPFAGPPQFGPNGEILALDPDGGMVKLK